MSEPIKVGDLVVVVKVRECCGNQGDIAHIYRVTGLHHEGHCVYCKAAIKEPVALLDGEWKCKPLSRLKRINPLTESESTEHREVIEA